ncbi:MBL fold metallo-hydrolase [Cryptosporangium arvum]|uniref:Zn-dependent hydrolase, glyoxylase n=1 Tax=Cryptosporangium arvum DSM 44712 TaxID=927661 RepID=A0A010Z4Z4_9ACTN|nr:MBL fold metallo-hydrolase [Cryptosporangium arvum]EXG82418.1 Zn-dependent hydrolase, glyoxylase [Cryptosporangium arvum DSM 44712]
MPALTPLPAATPPVTMTIHQLPTGSYSTKANMALRGGSRRETVQFAATAVLVQHPSGDVLIDAGLGRDVEKHQQMLPGYRRVEHRVGSPVVDQLAAAGYDPHRLSGILITHSHWDHVSGVPDLAAPVLITAAEVTYAKKQGADKIFTSFSPGHPLREYTFDGGPYLGFAQSHDLYGDGSIVIVPAAGHTTGSVIVFVALPSGERYAFIGDLTWRLEGIEKNIERLFLMRLFADSDRKQVTVDRERIIAIADLVRVVPAHDERGFAGIPLLVQEAGRGPV